MGTTFLVQVIFDVDDVLILATNSHSGYNIRFRGLILASLKTGNSLSLISNTSYPPWRRVHSQVHFISGLVGLSNVSFLSNYSKRPFADPVFERSLYVKGTIKFVIHAHPSFNINLECPTSGNHGILPFSKKFSIILNKFHFHECNMIKAN